MHNPAQFTGPGNIRVDAMSKEQLEQEVCSLYLIIQAITDAPYFSDMGKAIDAAKAYMESDRPLPPPKAGSKTLDEKWKWLAVDETPERFTVWSVKPGIVSGTGDNHPVYAYPDAVKGVTWAPVHLWESPPANGLYAITPSLREALELIKD